MDIATVDPIHTVDNTLVGGSDIGVELVGRVES